MLWVESGASKHSSWGKMEIVAFMICVLNCLLLLSGYYTHVTRQSSPRAKVTRVFVENIRKYSLPYIFKMGGGG